MADDLTQDTFIRAFAQLRAYRGEAPFGVWLHRIAVSVVLNGLRSQRRREARELPFAVGESAAFEPAESDPALSDALEKAMRELSAESRLIVILHEIEGYSPSEIARITRSLPGTVRVRLARAKARLRTMLKPYSEASLK